MPQTNHAPRKPRVSRTQVALDRLADAQAATQAELHDLVAHIRHLTEAQVRTEERLGTLAGRVDGLAQQMGTLAQRVDTLTQRVDTLTQRVDDLAQQMGTLTQRVDTLTQRMDTLTQRMDTLTQRVDDLATAQRRTEDHLATLALQLVVLTSQVNRMDGQLGNLVGDALEQRYRSRASGYFDDLLSGIRVLSHDDIGRLLDPAVGSGTLTRAERRDAIDADIVLHGQRISDRADAYLVAEVSASISTVDTERAVRRSGIIARATGVPVITAVAGPRIHQDADRAAREAGMWRILDGTTLAPADAVPAERVASDE
jgi:chaperonin cofactor prefoldin